MEFRSGSALLATDTTAPYAFSWTNVAAGSYTLTARACERRRHWGHVIGGVYHRHGAAVPAPWTAVDIGPPALSGSTGHSGGQFTVDASGTDIWGTSDQFHFVYQSFSGDVQITARVDSPRPSPIRGRIRV